MKSKNLHAAKRNKNDEFYTQLSDIESELQHYKIHFKGKTVLCNCDDPRVSNFFKYFASNFKELGLKKLVTACYGGQRDLFNPKYENGFFSECTGKKTDIVYLNGSGDFRSLESIELLQQADIVVTNPPFSLFREYVAQLVEYNKKFLIIGNMNAFTYKETFSLIRDNKMWLGNNPVKEFLTPEGQIKKFGNILWYTNLSHGKQNEELILSRDYYGNEEDYPKYDNYDAIEVSRVKNIPRDYDGVMGVPITFLGKYNPEQFKIVGLMCDKREKFDAFIQGKPVYLDENHKNFVGAVLNGKATYARIIIRRKK